MGTDFSSLNGILETIQAFVGDAVIDTLEIIPFLFVTYLLLEFMEHKMSKKSIAKFEKAGPLGPFIGSALGILPQCGFSSAASTLYAGRVITIGTLFAVYLSTSDEMIPIFIAGGIPVNEMIGILAAKFVIGLVIGFAVDGFVHVAKLDKKIKKNHYEIQAMCERDHCSCGHDKNEEGKVLKPAIQHTFQVTVFIFLITFLLNVIIQFAGGYEAIANFVNMNKYMSVIATSLIGLIPNCASSVAISQVFVDGIIGPGALLAGLLDAAGVGLIVLFRNNRPVKQNIIITVILFVISIVIGLIVTVLVG